MADPAYIVDGVLTDGEAWVGIATTTLGAGATSVTFTSTDDGQVGDWSQYMDLVLITYTRTNYADTSDNIRTAPNGDTTSTNFVSQRFYGTAGAATAQNWSFSSYGIAKLLSPAANSPSNVFAAHVVDLFDINSGKYKSSLLKGAIEGWEADGDSGDGRVDLHGTTWISQAPITSLVWEPSNGTEIVAGSMFSLFGVLPRMVA